MSTTICYQYNYEHGNGYWDKEKINCALKLLTLNFGPLNMGQGKFKRNHFMCLKCIKTFHHGSNQGQTVNSKVYLLRKREKKEA